MIGTRALVLALLAAMLAGGAPAVARQAGGARTGVTTRLTADVPAAIRRGDVVSLILHVRAAGDPAGGAGACLAAVPLFVSGEDALDSTPAGGVDLGVDSAPGPRPTCTAAIAGVPTGPGTYAFTWEPDTPGRVNLTFTAGGGALTIPVDVASAPPSTAILACFVVFTVMILGAAARLRRHVCSGRASS